MEDTQKGRTGVRMFTDRRRFLLPLPIPRDSKTVKVDNERQLLAMARTLKQRVEQDPEFSILLIANPVLALKAYGIELSPQMQDHVLRSLRHPKLLRERRALLESRIYKNLGEAPCPDDPVWFARLVFETCRLKPKDLRGLEPAYEAQPFDKAIKALQDARPAPTSRYPGVRRLGGSQMLSVGPPRPATRRLDIAASVPDAPILKTAPKTLTLEEAWFYKDDPAVADVVELGIIMRRALPLRTAEQFRKLQSGEATDVFRAFVRMVHVKDSKGGIAPEPSAAAS
ncbi:hypothetical protein U1763_00070 [Sphingomonas sp. LB2R24]|uniref:hypothetical protein n=1 Tax=Sphingomonas sorbitolis TaxID=3096165 RepID=UPI002FCB624B